MNWVIVPIKNDVFWGMFYHPSNNLSFSQQFEIDNP